MQISATTSSRHVNELNIESRHVDPHNVATQQMQEDIDEVDLFVGAIYNTEDTHTIKLIVHKY